LVDPNTRQGKRTPVTLKIKFKSETLEQFIERYAVDVSQGGIFIRTKEPLAVGTQMRFEFQLRDASPLIGGEGTVVWTRENDPSRPAIAPGMGVRFDRLADGSQSVLERILAEKAKQAPQRSPGETTKPPMFADTPTRVAPPPVQEALFGSDSKANRRPAEGGFVDQHTPLPKPMPFHSDADEFPEEAFEEATKVRALDELIAQTAGATQNDIPIPQDELAARRGPNGRADSTLSEPPESADPAATAPGFASGRGGDSPFVDRDSAPGLPSPPETSAPGKAPRLLDTSPSPRTETPSDPMEKLAKTKLGLEPVHVATRPGPTPVPSREVPARPSGMSAIAAEPTASVRMPAKRSSAAPIVILVLVLLAAAGAGVWFFVLREQVADDTTAAGSGSTHLATGSGSAGSAEIHDPVAGSGSAGSGSNNVAEHPGSAAATGPLVETEIASSVEKSTVEIVGTALTGPAPFKTKLEKDKQYHARVIAPGYTTLEVELKGGQDKVTAKLVAKPRVISVTSEPAGALITVDGAAIGHSTPFELELTKAQAAKKSVRIGLRKNGFRPMEKVFDNSTFVEDATQLVGKVAGQLQVQIQIVRPPVTNTGSGSGSGSGSAAGSNAAGSAAGSNAGSNPTAGSGAGSSATAPPPAGSGTAPEPTPDFAKP
jgi:uncharacterized protein (TIGR02266 family)